MKHTILSLMLAFLAGLSTLSAANYSGTCGNDLIWTLNTNDSILIIYGSGAMDDYSSSSSAPWYSYRSKIKGVNLPNELTSIGNYAFNDCSNLASITFNENLESIGSYSFYKCKALKSIYLPNSITSIGDKAFASSLATTITIEKNTPPSIGKNVFPSGTMIDNSSELPEIVEIRTTIYVPCELVQIYQTQWKDYSSRITNIPFPYTIGILLKSQGTLLDSQNDVSVACDNGFKLSAPTYTGYHFTQWSDGNTDNPRSVDVASNTVFTAEYEINYYSLHLSCDTSKGSVSPLEGTYAHSSDVVISATPKQGFKFQRWSDADTNNPRTLTLYKDVELSAIFVAEDPIKAISVNGELIPIADTMFVYDEHESTYIPQIETLTKSETANAEVVRLDNTDYGWNAVVHIKESNVILKEYTLFIFSNSNKQKVRITLTGEDRTSFSLSSNTDAFSSVVGNTRHETKYNTFSSYTGYKLGNKPSHIGLLFPLGTLQQGDIVSVLLTQESDIGEGEMFFYSDEGITPIKTIQGVYKPGLYSFVLGNNAPQLRSIYLYRNDMEMNPYVAYLEISRIHSAFTYSISCNELQGQVNIENNIGIIKAEAIPNRGYHFTQWSDGVTDNLRTIILTQDTVITAEFSANKYDISVTCDTTQGSIAGASGEFDYMSTLTYRAIPNNGYQFSIWSDGVTDNPRTIVLTRDTVITALYNINYYKVDFVDWDNSILKSDSVEYLSAAVPPTDPVREGYTFIGWDKEVPSVTQDTVITALYNINRYTISVICDTTQGTIEGASGEYDYLTQLSYTAIPNVGYTFTQWSDGNTDNPRTIILTQDTTFEAVFNINRYKVDFVDWDNSILKSDIVEYLSAAIPPANPTREGYTFIGWDKEVSAVTQDTVITALYNINYYRVDFVDWDNSILKSDSVEYLSAAVPPTDPVREGYTFIGWDKEVPSVTQDTVITALYNINRYTISVICDTTQGTIEGASGEYDYLTQLSYTAIPHEGYTFTQWSDGNTDNPRTIILTQDTTFTAEFRMEGNCLLLSETRGDSIKWELSCDSILTIEGNGTWGGSEQFNFAANKNAVKKVIIKDGVKRIGAMSFLGLENIVSIEIPNSVTSIGDAAFGHCSSLTSITLPTNLTSLGKRAFNACTSLTTIVWNAKNCFAYTDNTYSSFYSVKGNITTFVIGDSVEYLPPELCSGMNKLSAVHISDIAAWCRINFENSKTANPLYYAHHLYLNNEEIINLVIPEGVTEISNRAFAGYSAMKTVSIPSTVVRIGHTAFDGCTGLTSVVIPDGVTTIGNTAFTRCSNLQSVVLGDNVTTIGEGVFTECTSLKSPIYNRHTFLCMPTSYSGAYLVPDGIKTIAGSAFYKCKGLTSIDIPNSVTALGEAAFRECTKLEEVTIGTGVTALGKNVFNKCASIKKVQWNAINYRQSKPNTDTNCFPFYASRDSITSFIFGDSVEYIPVYLLKDFSAINNLVIPASVTEIGEYAFTNDTLVEITCYAETPPVIDSTAVVGVNKSTCILYVPYTSVNAYRNAEVWKEFVNIQAIGAEEVEEPGDAIVVTPSSTSASLIWTLISNAATYELVIRDMNGNVICTLTFNALGQLTGIAFAPNRSREAQQTQAAGFQFTVSGLNSGTTYEYALTAFDENDNIIETLTGTFTTTNDVSTDIEQINEDALNIPQKIMRDGNVYILRGDKVFTLHGKEVK